MTTLEGVMIVDVTIEERVGLDRILEESFEGWYLRHSNGILRDVEVVRAAISSGNPIGLVMLKTLEEAVGYVYYIAVARAHRRMGIGRLLLEDSVRRFKAAGAREVFAGVETDNRPSEALFASEGFIRTSYGEVSKKYGRFHALNMYRMMLVVPGEVLLRKEIA
jgi:ribosomal protein S18 acetylase RimI-like enzyme